ncbi:leucyl/phenylalanyl-tRNA--protein transferase [Phenylobacterium kunshanense]|uniref:Leucyl/phenylalanyl-tRNA--protein transferase n=1 Tax=Phenylobacterium kunshanense TaxID=1445034 RepID=A0A328BRA9_9CAUL|nr:leucyl/phenylalanyl-tRNA--protein transferase [Phenylobacterium kunshanense]
MHGFDARDLLDCYARGVFPMADAREDASVFLIDPERRGVIPLDRFHVSRRLARTVRGDPFEVRTDTAFHEVVLACAASGPGRTETWINRPIERLYVRLHELGHAHSVECWQGGELVGGLYGVSLRGAFFGESMFSRRRDASKVALVHLVARLVAGGYRLLDAQFMTEHLAQFGAEEIPRAEYHRRLAWALKAEGDFYGLGDSDPLALGAGAGDASVETAGAATLAGGRSSIFGAAGSAAGGALTAGAAGAAEATLGPGALALQLITQAS